MGLQVSHSSSFSLVVIDSFFIFEILCKNIFYVSLFSKMVSILSFLHGSEKKNPFQGAVNSGELCCEWVAQWAGLTAFSGSQLEASVPVQGERCPLEFSSDSEAACQLAQACWAFLDQHKHVRGTTYLSVALHPRGG